MSPDEAMQAAGRAYRAATNVERAGGDLLAGSTPPSDLVVMLRRAQDERNAAIAETIRLESKLTIAEIAIATAQQENRAPVWPPASASDPSV